MSSLPGELERPFRLIAFDWDGTAVTSRSADASRVVGVIDSLLGAGVRIAIVTGTHFGNVANQLGRAIDPDNRRRLFVSANRGSEVFGFDRRGDAVVLWDRHATEEEDAALTAIAEDVKTHLERITQLPIGIVRDRKNRRKIDLIPEPRWIDPPKSAIGELLAATEARLRGGGLRNGLREAFELTERVARERGLPGAKVTSDVKHIEVGLTDKSDAMEYLFREIAAKLDIAPEDVLVLGDEFGPIAGFEGSDHKMLAVPEMAAAVVVSVGPEPGGAPPRVLHVGGGPDRFCEVLEHQLHLDRQLGIFGMTRDAAWLIEEPGFDVAREHEIESILAISNGYLGSRASIAEGSSVSRPATFLAGAFEQSADVSSVPELLNVPDWGRLRFVVEGSPLGVETGEMKGHRRVLDLRRGVLLREGCFRAATGHQTRLRTIQVASLANRHVLLEGVEIVPENFSGSIRVDAILAGGVRSASGASHWESFTSKATEEGPVLSGVTKSSLRVTLASRLMTNNEGAEWESVAGTDWAAEGSDVRVRLAERCTLHRTVSLFSSRDVGSPEATAVSLRAELSQVPLEQLLAEHEAAWKKRWRLADVTIEGAPEIQRALRFAIYHLIAAANPDDPRTSVGARALAGEAYRGHVFWDTEIFMLPFYVHCYPEAARSMLRYRHRTLDAARRKATRFGYQGALYAWESADTGDETTPDYVVSSSGQVVRVLSGVQEQHITADVAFAAWSYARATGDRAFASLEGIDILVETARFWASRVKLGTDDLFHILEVIGPDEYHEGIDDNAFTNWMARHNLIVAADAVQRDTTGEAASRLIVSEREIEVWRDVATRMYLGLDRATGMIEQFAGYFGLEPIDVASYSPRTVPLDVLLGRERTQRSQVVKQADVLQLITLLWDLFTAESRRENFLYYDVRTGHGSSLSPGTHALVAARLGLTDLAMHYLEQTARIDLGNNMGNSAGGVHAASLGGLWQAVVLGVGGVRQPILTNGQSATFYDGRLDADDTLCVDPHLLPGWRWLSFPLFWRGRSVRVDIERAGIEVSVDGERPLCIVHGGQQAIVAEPGRVYAARAGSSGLGKWEAIR